MCDVNEKGLQKKFIVPLVVSELAPAESSEPEVARAGAARREVEAAHRDRRWITFSEEQSSSGVY